MLKTPLLDTILAILVLASLFFMISCSPAVPNPTEPTRVPSEAPISTAEPLLSTPRLRIKNTGTSDIKNLTVLFPESRIFFGDIPAGTISEYQPAPKGVYNYAAYEYTVNDEIRLQPVTDWVGESPRPGQSYTYELSFDPKRQNGAMIELVGVQADLNTITP